MAAKKQQQEIPQPLLGLLKTAVKTLEKVLDQAEANSAKPKAKKKKARK